MEPFKPVSLKLVAGAATVVICENVVQLAPVQRSIRYWLMVPPVSVEAVHDRLICVGPEAVADRLPGAVGELAGVVAEAVFEYALKFTPSVTRTR